MLLLGLLIIERRYANLEDKQGNQIPSHPKQLAAHLFLNNKQCSSKSLFLSISHIIYLSLSLSLSAMTGHGTAESILLEIISADEIRKHLQHYSSVPHVAGSNEDYNQALYTQEKWISLLFLIFLTHLVTHDTLTRRTEWRRLAFQKWRLNNSQYY